MGHRVIRRETSVCICTETANRVLRPKKKIKEKKSKDVKTLRSSGSIMIILWY